MELGAVRSDTTLKQLIADGWDVSIDLPIIVQCTKMTLAGEVSQVVSVGADELIDLWGNDGNEG